jgi:1-acyl-sn-glycerol-3-phosphate acyltransferase
MSVLRTLFAGASSIGITGALSPVVTVCSFISDDATDQTIFLWANSILKASGVHTQVRGLENLPSGNFVLCVNHQSNFDALILFRHIRRHFRYVAKASLRKLPVFGYALHRAGNIFIDRNGSRSDRSKMQEAVKAVQTKVSVVFFAEGTRSEDGQLRAFKKGAAIMALEAQVPLIPVAIAGAHEILPKGGFAIRAHPAALIIGKPILTTGKTVDDKDSLTEEAHAAVAKLLSEGNELVAEMKRNS